METEVFFSGYCRTVDASRMVAVIFEGQTLVDADCCYVNCPHKQSCLIAKQIDERIEANG